MKNKKTLFGIIAIAAIIFILAACGGGGGFNGTYCPAHVELALLEQS